MTKALFVFRRDLRIEDNTGLNAALRENKEVFPCFLFDERQIGTDNPYQSAHALGFMRDSLSDLESDLRAKGGSLSFVRGIAEETLPLLAKKAGIPRIYFNRDYTPFSHDRDQRLGEHAKELGIEVQSFDDVLLNPPDTIQNSEGKPFSVFTRFYIKAREREILRPETADSNSFSHTQLVDAFSESDTQTILKSFGEHNKTRGGRNEGLNILNRANEFREYKNDRDYPDRNGTTRLSAHLKFGTISPREAYWTLHDTLGNAHEPVTRQLYWRDFFTHIAAHRPRVFGHTYNTKFDRLKWDEPGKQYEAWKNGMTGFPIVDAGMRELNETGYMHNRARMITASFLIKDLHLHWLLGERYFATQLLDYDPAVNNGNWQWVAGTGCDAQPWFRIFNPWLQQKKFDPDAVYIKAWIPELKDVPVDSIHAWETRHESHSETGYPPPILEHAKEAKETKLRYGRA